MGDRKYLITVQSMNTAGMKGSDDRAEVVMTGTYVADLDRDANVVGAEIKKLADNLDSSLAGAPIFDRRPMTDAEIREWRDDQAKRDDLLEGIANQIAGNVQESVRL